MLCLVISLGGLWKHLRVLDTSLPVVLPSSLIACLFRGPQESSFAHEGLGLCKTLLHLAYFSWFQFKCLLGVIFFLSSLQTLRDLLQLANKLSLSS